MARKILLADDSVTAQNMGRKILADAGYEVITVNNGSAALKRISETKPDLIVLDVYMPGYSGLEVCQRLKESGDTSRIPVVLTVGKLEPFKPEEAKRVRADGFIVKPFEASELLSALSKLEDRIVPRPEPAKPGRFARANAAIDASYDKSVANTEEDAGWKNRISFPTKKKATEPDDADDSTIYNPVNKDLRTTVEVKKSTPKAQELQEEQQVNLGALAPEGLPKDVTPEEIAALAAAAAQVKGKLSEAPEPPAPPKPAEAVAEAKVEEIKAAATQAAVTQEDKAEPKAEPQAASESPKEAVAVVSEPVAQPEEKIAEAPAETPVIAASTELAPIVAISAPVNSDNGPGHREDEPVTMAVAAGAEYSPIPTSRWKAIPVAVLAEEAALALEEEMRKALSAVAAAEMAQPAPATTKASADEAASAAVASAVSSVAVVEPVPAAPIEPAMTMSAIASVANDAISEAVKDLEAVAASFTELHKPEVESAVIQPEPAAAVVASIVPAATEKMESPMVASEPGIAKSEPAAAEPKTSALDEKVVEAKIEDKKPEDKKIEEVVNVAEAKPVEVKLEAQKIEDSRAEVKRDEPKIDEAKADEPKPLTVTSVEAVSAETVAEIAEKVAESSKTLVEAAAASAQEVPDELAKPAASHKSVFGGIDEMAKKESEVAEHTAAAWASWRRIRDDGKSDSSKGGAKESKAQSDDAKLDEAKAAMAVAAGAEKAPEEAAAGEDSEVSAIVDSVLADLRPKIVEEISRKLGKKK